MTTASIARASRRPWIAIAGILLVATIGLAAACAWPVRPTITQGTIDVHGLERQFRLVIPNSAREQTNVPIVFALHGANDTTDEMADHTELDQLAAEKGFLLVYLQGRIYNWPPFIPPEKPDHMEPDFDFFTTMCDFMVSQYHADPLRIYMVGVSQGGAMANAITAKRSERIAATVVGCGWMPEPLDVEPLGTRHKCPMLFLVGSRDRQVPLETVRVGYEVFKREGHPVELRVVDGFGHGWPSAENDRVWDFLAAHRLPEAARSN
jgi:poly(3-hydroxybutyrate) depolymerase